jgi:hypothetical protein
VYSQATFSFCLVYFCQWCVVHMLMFALTMFLLYCLLISSSLGLC